VALQQRHVLERGGVEHDLGAALGEHPPDRLAVAQVGQDQLGALQHGRPAQGELHGVQGRLVPVEHHQLGRPEALELPAQLRADRAAGAGDEHPAAGQVAGDRVQVRLHLLPAQQVGDQGIADVPDGRRLVQQFAHRRQHLEVEPGTQADVAHRPQQGGVRVGHRQDHGTGARAPRRGRDVGPAAQHPHALHPQVSLVRVVVDQADRQVPALRVAQHRADQVVRGRAGAEQQHRGRPLAVRAQRPVAVQAADVPRAEHQHERHRRAEQWRADRHRPEPPRQVGGEHHGGGQQHGGGDRPYLVEAARAVPAAVEQPGVRQRAVHAHREQHDGDRAGRLRGGQAQLVPGEHGPEQAQRPGGRVHGERCKGAHPDETSMTEGPGAPAAVRRRHRTSALRPRNQL
jgi:hypothetical protein